MRHLAFLPLLLLIFSLQPALAGGDLSATQNPDSRATVLEPFLMERFDVTNKDHIKGVRASGELGFITLEEAENIRIEEILDYLSGQERFLLLGLDGDEVYRIEKVQDEGDDRQSIYFRQYIDDVPVDFLSSIGIDHGVGTVYRLSVRRYLRGPELSLVSLHLSEGEAIQLAVNTLAKAEGFQIDTSSGLESIVVERKLKLDHDTKTLHPIITIGTRVGERFFHTLINLATRKVVRQYDVLTLIKRVTTDTLTHICQGVPSIDLVPTSCQPNIPGEVLGIYRLWETIVDGNSKLTCYFCGAAQAPEFRVPYDATNAAEDYWSTIEPGYCCKDMPDIDVIIDTTIEGIPFVGYFPPIPPVTHGRIFSSPKGKSSLFERDVYPSASWDVMLHEFAHAYLNTQNEDFLTNNSNEDMLLFSLEEALADVLAILTHRHSVPGITDWIIAEGYLVPDHVRNHAQDRSFEDYNPEPFNPNSNITIFGNYFYRLSQKPGVSLDQLVRLALRLPRAIQDGDPDTPGYDFKDFKNAVDQVLRDIDSNPLRDAVHSVHQNMLYPSGVPYRTPQAPAFLNGSFDRCSDYSWDLLSWENVLEATAFEVWGQAPGETYQPLYSSSSIWAFVGVRGYPSANWKVKSCNPAGCSDLSSTTYFQTNRCQ